MAKVKRTFLKRMGALALTLAMVLTMIPFAQATTVTPPENGVAINSESVYTQYGEDAIIRVTVALGPAGSENYTAMTGGLFQLSAKNSAILDSLTVNDFDGYTIGENVRVQVSYNNKNHNLLVSVPDEITTSFYFDLTLKGVTENPEISIDAVDRYGKVMIDALIGHNGESTLISRDQLAIGTPPTVKFFYDMDVAIDGTAPGTVSYTASTKQDDPLTLVPDATPTTLSQSNKTHSSKSGTTDKTTFTITPEPDYAVDYATATLPNGTKQQLTRTATDTYVFEGLSSVTSGDQKVQINVKFKQDDGTRQHTVTFNTRGGSEVPSQVVNAGDLVIKPATDPTLRGYTFGGWYKEETCQNSWDFTKDTVDGDTTLYAKWRSTSDILYGDVNDDGVVNSKDAIILARYMANWSGITINEENSDVNCDGTVNSKDVIILTRYLANWDVKLGK